MSDVEENVNEVTQLSEAESDYKEKELILSIADFFVIAGSIASFFLGIIFCAWFFLVFLQNPSDLVLIFAVTCGILALTILVLVVLIRKAGTWFKFGLDLSRKKGVGLIKFTTAGKILFSVEKKAKSMEFWKGKKDSKYFLVEKGYLEPTTGATFYTVKEGMPTDFDVNKEFKIDLTDLTALINNKAELIWDAAILWASSNQQLIRKLLFIIIGIGVVCACLIFADLYFTGDSINKVSQQIIQVTNDVNSLNAMVKNLVSGVILPGK